MRNSRTWRKVRCGFKGEGTPSKWVKTTPYGDYRNQPTRLADKAREIGKNTNRTKPRRDRNLGSSYLSLMNDGASGGLIKNIVRRFRK